MFAPSKQIELLTFQNYVESFNLFYSLYLYFIITVIPILLEYGSQSSLSVFLSNCLGPRHTNFFF